MCILRAQPQTLGTVKQCHELSGLCRQFRPKGLEARCMLRGLLSSPNAGIRRTLAEADQLVHVSIKEIEFPVQVGSHRPNSWIEVNALHESSAILEVSGFGA
jgi:hypothetical protein